MTPDPRVVVDTNVLISQLLLPQSTPSRAVRAILRIGTLLSSAEHLREVFDVVMRAKFDAYAPRDSRIEEMRRLAELAEPVSIVRKVRICRDPKDDMLLEIAVNGRGTHIVTGDADLLALDPFEDIRIATSTEFLAMLKA